MIHPFRSATLGAALSLMALTAPAQAFDITSMTEDDWQPLRDLGFDDQACLEVAHTWAYSTT